MQLRGWVNFGVVSGAMMASGVSLRAAEQITLRNGFEITCHHHAVTNDRVRLYTGATNDNYIEVAPADIASVERIPDPPAPAPEPASAAVPAAVSVSSASGGMAPAKGAVPAPTVLSQEDLNEMLAKAEGQHNVD